MGLEAHHGRDLKLDPGRLGPRNPPRAGSKIRSRQVGPEKGSKIRSRQVWPEKHTTGGIQTNDKELQKRDLRVPRRGFDTGPRRT